MHCVHACRVTQVAGEFDDVVIRYGCHLAGYLVFCTRRLLQSECVDMSPVASNALIQIWSLGALSCFCVG